MSAAHALPSDQPTPEIGSQRAGHFTLTAPLCYLLILVAGLLAYGLSLNADFYMDDYPHIVDRAFVKGEADADFHYKFRIVPYLLYRGIYAVAGPSALAFHLLNLAIHLGTACALFACGGALFRRLKVLTGDRWAEFGALAGALIFAVHPFASEAVNYARCSMIGLVTLSTVLSVWSVLMWLEKRRPRYLIYFAAFALLGIFSKEVGFLHIGFSVALVTCATASREQVASLLGKSRLVARQRKWQIVAIPVVLCLGYLSWWWVRRGWAVLSRGEFFDHALTQGRVIWGYFINMLAPTGLLADHQIAWSRSASDLPALLGLIGIAILGFVAVFLVVKRRTRAFGILFALLLFPIYLRLLYPMYEHVVEYRAYSALPWFALIVGMGIGTLAKSHWRTAQWGLTGIVIAGTTFSAIRTAAWSDAAILAHQSIDKYPFNNRARTILQGIAYRSGEYAEVFALREQIHAVYNTTMAFNSSNRWGREYDMGRANFDLINCEQLTAYTIAEIHGSEKALQFVEARLTALSERFGPFESDKDREATLGSLLTVRDVLHEHGVDYDRDKQNVAATENPDAP